MVAADSSFMALVLTQITRHRHLVSSCKDDAQFLTCRRCVRRLDTWWQQTRRQKRSCSASSPACWTCASSACSRWACSAALSSFFKQGISSFTVYHCNKTEMKQTAVQVGIECVRLEGCMPPDQCIKSVASCAFSHLFCALALLCRWASLACAWRAACRWTSVTKPSHLSPRTHTCVCS